MLALDSKTFCCLSLFFLAVGCATSDLSRGVNTSAVDPSLHASARFPEPDAMAEVASRPVDLPAEAINEPVVQLTAYQGEEGVTGLADLEQMARDRNPRLTRLYQEYQGSLAKSQYADKLPDPRFGANVFGNAIETASGSQRANMTFSQAIPWISRLKADEQRAIFDAYAIAAELEAETLRIEAAVRTNWYRLYVLDKQIEIAQANQQLLQSLIDVANARIATGAASQGDVLLGTLELSQLEERLLTYRRQRLGVQAELNRLVARDTETPIASPKSIHPSLPSADAEQLIQIALQRQPEIEAAQMKAHATRWGVEVARLMRRPEFVLSASYYPTDDNRPPSTVVDVGQDPWALGAQVSIPIWHNKYDAMENEAKWKHQAAHSSVDELADRYEAMIVDLLAEAHRAQETATLYESTILPQARQTLDADQEAYSNGAVEFDRVIRDYRNLLTLEVGFHQALGDLATSVAKLSQATGTDTTVIVPSRP